MCRQSWFQSFDPQHSVSANMRLLSRLSFSNCFSALASYGSGYPMFPPSFRWIDCAACHFGFSLISVRALDAPPHRQRAPCHSDEKAKANRSAPPLFASDSSPTPNTCCPNNCPPPFGNLHVLSPINPALSRSPLEPLPSLCPRPRSAPASS